MPVCNAAGKECPKVACVFLITLNKNWKLQTIFQILIKITSIFINVNKNCLKDIFCVRDQGSRNLKRVGSQQKFVVTNKNLALPNFWNFLEIELLFIKIKYFHLIAKCNIIIDHRAIWRETSFLLLSFFADYHIISTWPCNLRVKKMYWI